MQFKQVWRSRLKQLVTEIGAIRRELLERQLCHLSGDQRMKYEKTFGSLFVSEDQALSWLRKSNGTVERRANELNRSSDFFPDEKSGSVQYLLKISGLSEELNLDLRQQKEIVAALVAHQSALKHQWERVQSGVQGQFNDDVINELPMMLFSAEQQSRFNQIRLQVSLSSNSNLSFGLTRLSTYLALSPGQLEKISNTEEALEIEFVSRLNTIHEALHDTRKQWLEKQLSNLNPKQRKTFDTIFGEVYLETWGHEPIALTSRLTEQTVFAETED
jgi:hypothetical protein